MDKTQNMNGRKLTLAAVAMSAATYASAQNSSVILYGVIDTGIEYISHAGAGGSGSLFRMTAGNVAGSRWGIRGTEDLGGGNSAQFVLENGFFSDTGASGQGGRLFGRQNYVGLEGDWGALTLGRQNNALFGPFFLTDPMKHGLYGLGAQEPTFGGRLDNSIKYRKSFGSLSISGIYSFGYDGTITNGGEVPGSFRVGQEFGTAVSYSFPNVYVVAGYEQRRGSTVSTQGLVERRYATGFRWDLSNFSLMGGYRLLQGTIGDPSQRSNLYWLGASYTFQNPLTLSGGVYRNDQRHSSNGATSVSVSAEYEFSKRTELFLNASYMANRGASTLTVSLGSPAVAPGVNQTGVVAGIKHIF